MSFSDKLRAVNWIRLIALWEMIGGVWGMVLLLQLVPAMREVNVSSATVGAFFAFTASSFAGGLMLLKGERFGRRLSLMVQGAQILSLRTPVFGWQVILGPFALLGWNGGDQFGLQVGATVKLIFDFSDNVTLIALNLIASAFFLCLIDEANMKALSGRGPQSTTAHTAAVDGHEAASNETPATLDTP